MKRKALIVEDEPDIAELMSDRLEAWGYETALAGSGQAALEMLETEAPDFVLLDIRLPDQSGLDVLRTMRGKAIELPVIVVSASHGPNLEAEAHAAGADDFLLKPYEPAILKEKIESLLKR
jgi:DNA-binding response OmpR family regulator